MSDSVAITVGSVVRVEAVDWCRHEYQMSMADVGPRAGLKHAVLYGRVMHIDDERLVLAHEVFPADNEIRYAMAIPSSCIRSVRELMPVEAEAA